MSFLKFLISILLLFFNFSVLADNLVAGDNYKVSLRNSGSNAILTIQVGDKVKFYWRNPGEMGMGTKFHLIESHNLKNQKIYWPIPELLTENNLTSYVYKNNQDFLIKPSFIDNNKETFLKIKVDFTTCEETCENHVHVLEVTIQPNLRETEEVIQLLAKFPQPDEASRIISIDHEKIAEQDWLKVSFTSAYKQENPKIFLDLPDHVFFDPKKIELIDRIDGQQIRIPIKFSDKEAKLSNIYCLLVTDKGEMVEYNRTSIAEGSLYSFLTILIFALIGGLILNVMPCVLPIIALKACQLVNLRGKERDSIRKALVSQAIGMIFSFISIAIIIYFLQQIGLHVGFGLHFQQPGYLITMVLVLSLIAINLVEENSLNVRVPDKFAKIFDSERRDIIGFFLSGIFITLLAIPCTAPFVTIAAGYAITGDFIDMLAIFSLMGIGMSSPYILLSFYPGIAAIFPKPGNWMIKFKKIIGTLVFLSSIWLIFILSTQLGNKAALILFLIVILIKFILIDKTIFSNRLKQFFIIILFALSYLMPFQMHEEKAKEEILAEMAWKKYHPEEIDELIAKDHVVLVDITASWCATCVLNKMTTLNTDFLMNYMKRHNIIGMRADISAGNSLEVEKLMKEKKHFGIPLTIIYSKQYPHGKVMSTIISSKYIIEEIKAAM